MDSEEANTVRGWWSGHKVVDPVELERRFSNEDGLSFMDAVFYEDVSEESKELLERVESTLHLLPPTEADFVDLYYFRHLKQTDIAEIFGVSQPTVCYRLQRAARRIQFLLSLPPVEDGEIEAVLTSFLEDPLDTRIMLLMYQTTCQSEVAKQLGVSQGFVRHRFIRSIARMEKEIQRRREVVERGDDALDLLMEWGALEALDCTNHDDILGNMHGLGVLEPTPATLRAAATVLQERQFKQAKEAQRLGLMFNDEAAFTDEELRESTSAVEPEVVIEVARELRREEALDALRAIDAKEAQESDDEYVDLAKFVTIFQAISDNLNILREVQRPAWGNKVIRTIH